MWSSSVAGSSISICMNILHDVHTVRICSVMHVSEHIPFPIQCMAVLRISTAMLHSMQPSMCVVSCQIPLQIDESVYIHVVISESSY